MIPAKLTAITAAHIQVLVDEGVRERSDLDFKEKLPDRSDKGRDDFISDVCAFANARGGDILYGIQDKRDDNGKPLGVAGAVVGLARINPDHEMASLLQVLQQNTQPKISGIDWVSVEGAADGPVIVLRVPRSFSSPHMNTFKGRQRFHVRTGAQTGLLDIEGIRTAFFASESIGDGVRDFRAKRLMAIRAGEAPVSLMQLGTQLIIHVLPISSAVKNAPQIDPRLSSELLRPPPSQSDVYGGSRFNLDGAVGHWSAGAGTTSYLQVFRNAALEFAYAYCSSVQEERLVLDESDIDVSIRRSLEHSMNIFQHLERKPPYVLMVTLMGTRGATIYQDWAHLATQHLSYDRDDLLIPDVWIDDHPTSYDDVVRPVMDILWQACGHERCLRYDRDGRRTPRPR